MQNRSIATESRLFFYLALLSFMFLSGCEPYSTLSSTETAVPAPNPQPAPSFAPVTETVNTNSPATDITTPEQPPSVTNETEVVATSRFIWEPKSSSVRMVIPRNIQHWLLHISTTTPSVNHQIGLYGPDRTGGRLTAQGFEYILKGGGEQWRNDALAIDPFGRGAIVVFINTNLMQPSGYRTAHWIVPDPRNYYTGNPEKF